METAAHPRTLFKPRTFGMIFVTLTSPASLWTGVVKTFRYTRLMTTNSAAEKLPHQSRCLERGIITEPEFASSCLAYLIDEPNFDPVPVLLLLPKPHLNLIVANVVEFSQIDYYYPPPPDGGSEKLQREYQSQARIVCDAILAHFKP